LKSVVGWRLGLYGMGTVMDLGKAWRWGLWMNLVHSELLLVVKYGTNWGWRPTFARVPAKPARLSSHDELSTSYSILRTVYCACVVHQALTQVQHIKPIDSGEL
jgi:hypothetical protein